MSTRIYLLFVGLFVSLCFAANPQTILYNGLAVTLVPPTTPTGNPTLVLAPLNINDPNQQWNLPTATSPFISSANPNYANIVWDVNGDSKDEGTKVILYPKKPGNDPNQSWDVSNGVITSKAAAGFTVAPNGTSNLYMTYNPPTPATIQDPITQPWQCSSVGDPHITPYPNGRNDLYSPGSQQPGTYTLSKTGVLGDPDYLIIQADQQLCQPTVPGVYCNKRGIVKTLGHVIEVAGDTVTIDGVVTSVSGTLSLTNGVNVTKLGTNNYVVSYPNGNVQFQTISYYGEYYITATHGPIPTGGVCTPILGPNYNTTARSQAVSPYNFCLSWRATNISDDLFNYSDYLSWRAANPLNFTTTNGNFTTTNKTLSDSAYAACAPLAANSSLARQCAALVPTAPIAFVYQACLDDVIALSDPSFAPSAIDAYSKRCSANAAAAGISIVLPTSGANSVASGPGIASNIGLSNNPIKFNITARDVNGQIVTTGGDNFVVTSTGGFTFNITYLGLGVYQVTYTPNTIGTFNISVSLDGIASILNSPFTVTIDLQVTDPSKSTAFGPGLTTVPLSPSYPFFAANFTVVARTASGAQRTSGGDTLFISLTAGVLFPGYQDNNDGTYTVTYYTPTGGIPFKFYVFVSIVGPGLQIEGSPFTVSAVVV